MPQEFTAWSNWATVEVPQFNFSDAITPVQAVWNVDKVRVTWEAIPDVDGYQVERQLLDGTNSIIFNDLGLVLEFLNGLVFNGDVPVERGNTYRYRVRGFKNV